MNYFILPAQVAFNNAQVAVQQRRPYFEFGFKLNLVSNYLSIPNQIELQSSSKYDLISRLDVSTLG